MTSVIFEGSVFNMATGESVLDALVRGGAQVDFSCRKGTCQNCMLQVVKGEVGTDAVKGLRPALVEAGMFLPCCAHPSVDLRIERPDISLLYVKLMLSERRWLSPSVCELRFEPETNITWHAGQFMNLRRADGVVRSYSIASIAEEDYFLTFHVKRIAGGQMSNWLCDDLEVGDMIDAQGPIGNCYYEPDDGDANLLLIATGSGLAPLWGLCRDALRHDHRGAIFLYHASQTSDGLYLREELTALGERHERFHYAASLTRELDLPEAVARGRIVELAFGEHPELLGWRVYLCGVPDMVHEGRHRAVLAGVDRKHIHADPFDYAHLYQPDDATKIAGIGAETELWSALGRGTKLKEILTDFYRRAFADPRLSPFFHRITIERAIEQQYAFLSDLFSGRRSYFGLRPFNAHHWMVISDELFDYREELMIDVVREHGLAQEHIRRWTAVHELFRREIVKSTPRGMFVDGVEQPLEAPESIVVEVASMCDGCEAEMPVGARGRFHPQGGQLYCMRCTAVPASETPA